MADIRLKQVIDLTTLIQNEPVKVQSALCAEEFRTPFLMSVACALDPHKKILWMIQHLQRKTAQASYDDLKQVEEALKAKGIKYNYTLRDEIAPKKSYVRSEEHFRNVLARVGFGFTRS